ncbi:MAG: hypothetical protein ACI9VI_000494, partial [Candidatus Azotimanducaceae bacterium]
MFKHKKFPILKISIIPLSAIVLGFFVAAILNLSMLRSSVNNDYQVQRTNYSADNLKLRLDQS